jgi:hypothetical protein
MKNTLKRQLCQTGENLHKLLLPVKDKAFNKQVLDSKNNFIEKIFEKNNNVQLNTTQQFELFDASSRTLQMT